MRYPSMNNRLLIMPYELGRTVPTQEQIASRGVVTNHHLYFCKRDYMSIRWRQIFRALPEHVVPLLKEEHSELHNEFDPPKMPKDTLMIDVIEEHLATHGTIECVRENKTNEVYEIPLESWEMVKGLYRRVA